MRWHELSSWNTFFAWHCSLIHEWVSFLWGNADIPNPSHLHPHNFFVNVQFPVFDIWQPTNNNKKVTSTVAISTCINSLSKCYKKGLIMLDLRGASTLSTWTVSFSPDPVSSMQRNGHHVSWSSIVSVSVNIADLFGDEENSYNIFCKGERNARVALADIVARTIAKHATSTAVQVENYSLRLETLDRVSSKSRRRKSNNSIKYPPYVLERSDIFTTQNELLWVFAFTLVLPTLQQNHPLQHSQMALKCSMKPFWYQLSNRFWKKCCYPW